MDLVWITSVARNPEKPKHKAKLAYPLSRKSDYDFPLFGKDFNTFYPGRFLWINRILYFIKQVMRLSTPLYLMDVRTPVISGSRKNIDKFKGD
jgi:hypothetical protein